MVQRLVSRDDVQVTEQVQSRCRGGAEVQSR